MKFNLKDFCEKMSYLKDNIKVEGHIGTWHVIDILFAKGVHYYLVESEQYGDEAACLIIDSDGKLILEDVHNGIYDLIDHLEETNI